MSAQGAEYAHCIRREVGEEGKGTIPKRLIAISEYHSLAKRSFMSMSSPGACKQVLG